MSGKIKEQPVTYHRMSSMAHKATIVIWIKEILRYVPFLSYLCNCEPKQKIVVPIIENFNNKDFQANAIEFTLSNT